MPLDDRAAQYRVFEGEAELLVAHQLDLIAQLERQLRAIHRTMRQIEKLRSATHRVGPALTNGEKHETLRRLSDELGLIDRELATQHESCVDMQTTIDEMRARLATLKRSKPSEGGLADSKESAP
jgi:chaperonin cofactor prefoldin